MSILSHLAKGFLLSIWLWFLNGSRVPRLNGERFPFGVPIFERSIPDYPMIVFSGRCRVGRSVLIVMQRYGRLITGWCSTFADMLASMHDICFLWLYPDVDGRFSTKKKECSRGTKHLRVIS